jgi:hypothetical protein
VEGDAAGALPEGGEHFGDFEVAAWPRGEGYVR